MRHSAEPDPDRGGVNGPAPDEIALVEPGGNRAVLRSLAKARSTVLRSLQPTGSKAGGRPPALPRRSRLRTWSDGCGIVALIARRRRCARIAALEQALTPSTRPGRVRGRPGHGARCATGSSAAQSPAGGMGQDGRL